VSEKQTIRQMRLAQSKGLRAFAFQIGILPSELSYIETGRKPATPEQAAAICKGLGVADRSAI
jgi:transcriptional regulator with XRE-family HTH domain